MEYLVTKLRAITTIDFACNAKNLLEKLFWATIGLLGIIYAIYYVVLQLQLWDQTPSIVSNRYVELSELNFPAMTICPQGTTKNAIAERLGNYLKPNSDFLENLPSMKGQDLLLCTLSLGIRLISIYVLIILLQSNLRKIFLLL